MKYPCCPHCEPPCPPGGHSEPCADCGKPLPRPSRGWPLAGYYDMDGVLIVDRGY